MRACPADACARIAGFAAALAAAVAAMAAAPATARADDPPVAVQEVGVRLGVQLGLGTAPGGLRAGGVYLARMTDETWFDAEADVVFGGGGPDCYLGRDEARSLLCEPGYADGFGFQFAVGGRWFPTEQPSGFLPYLRGGVAAHLASFSDDGLLGVAAGGWAGGGGRFRVADGVAVGAEAILLVGAGWFDEGLGLEPYGQLVVQFGVDLAL